jgi:hypothetical protein
MADSVQEAGLVRIYRQTPDGNKTLLVQARVEDLAPAGGAPNGAGSSVSTPEKRVIVNSPVELVNDDILLITFESDAADTLDASDCIWSIPLVTPQGTKQLGRAQFANPTLGDQAMVASKEATIAGYKVTEGRARLSGRIYLDLQDDTA